MYGTVDNLLGIVVHYYEYIGEISKWLKSYKIHVLYLLFLFVQ